MTEEERVRNQIIKLAGRLNGRSYYGMYCSLGQEGRLLDEVITRNTPHTANELRRLLGHLKAYMRK